MVRTIKLNGYGQSQIVINGFHIGEQHKAETLFDSVTVKSLIAQLLSSKIDL